jgi:hypothetical protein
VSGQRQPLPWRFDLLGRALQSPANQSAKDKAGTTLHLHNYYKSSNTKSQLYKHVTLSNHFKTICFMYIILELRE